MEERLDMETERSGIVSANATVRRRRRWSMSEIIAYLSFFLNLRCCESKKESKIAFQVYLGELNFVRLGSCDHHYCSGEDKNLVEIAFLSMFENGVLIISDHPFVKVND